MFSYMDKDCVRTVSIIYKKRNAREKPEELNKKGLVKEKVGVQRLIVIQPANKVDEDVEVQPLLPDDLQHLPASELPVDPELLPSHTLPADHLAKHVDATLGPDG